MNNRPAVLGGGLVSNQIPSAVAAMDGQQPGTCTLATTSLRTGSILWTTVRSFPPPPGVTAQTDPWATTKPVGLGILVEAITSPVA